MAKFQKGHPKIGGRKAGVPNKESFPQSAQVLADIKRYPIAELVKIADASEDLTFKKDLWLTILDRVELPPARVDAGQPNSNFSLAWFQQTAQKMISAGAPPSDPSLQS